MISTRCDGEAERNEMDRKRTNRRRQHQRQQQGKDEGENNNDEQEKTRFDDDRAKTPELVEQAEQKLAK